MKVTNKITGGKKNPPASTYSKFGMARAKKINEDVRAWKAKQAFADSDVSTDILELEISGTCNSKEYQDSVQWQANFQKKPHDDESILNKKALHEKRLPNTICHNSTPHNFLSNFGYIHFDVRNDEKGWVARGEFPKGPGIVYDPHGKTGKDGISTIQVPAFIDIRRDAEAGFRAVKEWSKFRAMALASQDLLVQKIRDNFSALKGENGRISHADSCSHRGLVEYSTEIFLSLLPDVIKTSGESALKSFYMPGALEAAIALSLAKGTMPNFGGVDNPDERPISYSRGKPLEVISRRNGAYDARARVTLHTFGGAGDEDEVVRKKVQSMLVPFFDIEATHANEYALTLDIKDAHKVADAIRGGATDTKVHQEIENVRDALIHVCSSLETWDSCVQPAIKATYDAAMKAGTDSHFDKHLGRDLRLAGYEIRKTSN